MCLHDDSRLSNKIENVSHLNNERAMKGGRSNCHQGSRYARPRQVLKCTTISVVRKDLKEYPSYPDLQEDPAVSRML